MNRAWWMALAAGMLILTGATAGIGASVAAQQEDVSIGTPGNFVQAGRDYAAAGNWAMAESYANLALNLNANHAGAQRLLADARGHRATSALTPPPAGPARTQAVAAAGGGDPNAVGSAAYFLRHARYQLQNGAPANAARYAREALAVEPGNAEARRILAAAGSATPASPGSTAGAASNCDEVYGACRAAARRYTPGSGYSADYPAQSQCMVRRNICYAQTR